MLNVLYTCDLRVYAMVLVVAGGENIWASDDVVSRSTDAINFIYIGTYNNNIIK